MDCINDNWIYISKKCVFAKTEFLIAIRFILDSTFFIFDNIIYTNFWYAYFGSPLSPICCGLDDVKIEKNALMLFGNNIPLLSLYR